MTFPVLVEPCDGQFAAVLVGVPTIRAVGTTQTEALAALQADLAQRVARGELVPLELVPTGVSGLAGKYRTDPTLREISDKAYRMRDAEPQA
jgi:predicted RNase H-like HicB family nuclease